MPILRLAPDLEMFYLIDDFTDPWRVAETILLLHGNCESSAVWFGWVPHLARHLRVVRPDMRGYGASTPVARDFPWSLDVVIDDFVKLMDRLGVARFHLVGAKIAGTIARRFAARFPERVCTLTVVGTPPPRYDVAARVESLTAEIEQHGVGHWARRTMAGRLGGNFPPEGVEWWVKLMGKTPISSQICFVRNIHKADITADLPRIQCPTLVITTKGSGLASVEATRVWQSMIPHSELLVLPGDSYHVAASDADRCARETLAFIARCGASNVSV
jgi:pimeloyl-ACP methyl ester carboxylesterase